MGIIARQPKPSNSNLLVYGAGKLISAAEVNLDVQALYDLANGQLDTANLSPSAGLLYTQLVLTGKIGNADIAAVADINASKLLDLSILSGKIANDAVITSKIPIGATYQPFVVSSTTPHAFELVDTAYKALGDAALAHAGVVLPVTSTVLWWFNLDVTVNDNVNETGYLMWRMQAFDGALTTLDPAGGAGVGYVSHRAQAAAIAPKSDLIGRKVISGMIPALAAGTYSFEMAYELQIVSGGNEIEWTLNGTDLGDTPGVTNRSSLTILVLHR